MEAPEKIYLHPDIGIERFIRPWLKMRVNKDSVEYVNKDAFVEKAVKWLDGIIYDYIELKHANIDTFIDVDNKRLVEDFKKFMEG